MLMRWKQAGPRPIGIVPHGDLALGPRLAMAAMLELAWELAENSPSGDRPLSAGDAGGRLFGRQHPQFDGRLRLDDARFLCSAPAAVESDSRLSPSTFELLTLWTIRDNLTLNVLMLVSPVEAIKDWQAGA